MKVASMMPLNPRHSSKLGFYGLFAYLQHLGHFNGLKTLVLLNQVGVSDVDGSSVTLLQRALGNMELYPDMLNSDLAINPTRSQDLIRLMLDEGLVSEEEVQIEHCGCLKIQRLSGLEFFKTKQTLMGIDGKSRCCNSTLSKISARVLLTRPCTKPSYIPGLYPNWSYKELDWVYSSLEGQRLLISRLDRRHFSVSLGEGRKYWLDNDCISLFYPWLMSCDSIEIEHMISGVSTIRQAALMLMFADWLKINYIQNVHFLPRIDYGSPITISDLDSLLAVHGKNRLLNSLLWSAMSGKQRINLTPDLFDRVSESFRLGKCQGVTDRSSLLVKSDGVRLRDSYVEDRHPHGFLRGNLVQVSEGGVIVDTCTIVEVQSGDLRLRSERLNPGSEFELGYDPRSKAWRRISVGGGRRSLNRKSPMYIIENVSS